MKRLVLVPHGWPLPLGECSAGLFVCGDAVGLKTEYGLEPEAYCDSGEFWGGVSAEARRAVVVQPVEARWEDVDE